MSRDFGRVVWAARRSSSDFHRRMMIARGRPSSSAARAAQRADAGANGASRSVFSARPRARGRRDDATRGPTDRSEHRSNRRAVSDVGAVTATMRANERAARRARARTRECGRAGVACVIACVAMALRRATGARAYTEALTGAGWGETVVVKDCKKVANYAGSSELVYDITFPTEILIYDATFPACPSKCYSEPSDRKTVTGEQTWCTAYCASLKQSYGYNNLGNCARYTTKTVTKKCQKNLCPSPPPPSPSPPPPSPPPPGMSIAPIVTVHNGARIVTSQSIDFQITVSHKSCATAEDCFVSKAVEKEVNDLGLHCEALVELEGENCSATGYGDYLPCMRWIDFFPKQIPMTTEDGRVRPGKYTITSSCYFIYEDGSRVPQTDVYETLHNFTVSSGCQDVMPLGPAVQASTFVEVAKYLLLTADIFANADCSANSIYQVKDTVFRQYDNNPEDGVLSYEELVAAATAQSSDTYILKQWNQLVGGKLQLFPSQLMSADVQPLRCGESGQGKIWYKEVVYPKADTKTKKCANEASSVRATWRYNPKNSLSNGDYLCTYVDGVLYDKFVVRPSSIHLPPEYSPLSDANGTTTSLSAIKEINDIRPVSGSTLDSQQSLVASFLFDRLDSDSYIPSIETGSGTPVLRAYDVPREIGLCSDGFGGKCLKSVSASSELSKPVISRTNDRALLSSAVREEGSDASLGKSKCYCGPGRCGKAVKTNTLIYDAEYPPCPSKCYWYAEDRPSVSATQTFCDTWCEDTPRTFGLNNMGNCAHTYIKKVTKQCPENLCPRTYTYVYEGPSLLHDLSIATWMYVPCGSKISNADTKEASIVYLDGNYGGSYQLLNLFLRESAKASGEKLDLVIAYSDGDVNRELSVDDSVQCGTWSYVGFALNNLNGMLLYSSGLSNKNSTWSIDILKYTKNIRMFGAQAVEFDDVRVYSGNVVEATFGDAFTCGHRALCAQRIVATPQPRRVICANLVTSESKKDEYVCAVGMFYDGSVIDLQTTMDNSGVHFAFRDTSWEETSFEVIRQEAKSTSISSIFDTVVMIEGSLKGCAVNFASITYVDTAAGQEPNLEWYYRVRTKTSSGIDFVSTTHYFKSPWIATLSGIVMAGSSQVGVPYVRVCTSFASSSNPNLASHGTSSADLALHMATTVSNNFTKTTLGKAYVVTNGDPTGEHGSVDLGANDYVRIQLAHWSVVERVKVCVKSGEATGASIRPYVQEYDSGSSVNYGNLCEFMRDNSTEVDEIYQYQCFNYRCAGSTLTTFRGEYVAVEFTRSVRLTQVVASGTTTNCKFTAVTDKNGEFSIALSDTSGSLPSKADVYIGVNKEEVYPSTKRFLLNVTMDASALSEDVLLILRKDKTRAEQIDTSSNASNTSLKDYADLFTDGLVSFQALSDRIANRTIITNGHPVISSDLWNTWDEDGDDSLNATEFRTVLSQINSGVLVADPVVVFTPFNATYDDAFKTIRTKGECLNFVLARQRSLILPNNNSAWNEFYQRMVSMNADPTQLDQDCNGDVDVDAVVRGNDDYDVMVPMLATLSGPVSITPAMFQPTSSFKQVSATGAPAVPPPEVRLSSTYRPFDVVHEFNKQSNTAGDDDLQYAITSSAPMYVEKSAIGFKSVLSKSFTDDTVTYVKGAVLFPKKLAAGSTRCGLKHAKVKVTDSSGSSDDYSTDELGWFEIGVTRGKTVTLEANFSTHKICYAGKSITDATELENCVKQPTNVTLKNVVEETYVYFVDVTDANIDLGLFHGECDTLYTGATFKITPLNGCHAPAYVTSEDIAAWQANVKDIPDQVSPVPRSARVWPFAAMDYSITLSSGPSVSITDDLKKEPWYDDEACVTEDGDVVTYFRRRNTLERLALMQNNTLWTQIRYKYHGYICAYIDNIPKIADPADVCLGTDDEQGELKPVHFLGTANASVWPSVKAGGVLGWDSETKDIVSVDLRVFEAHWAEDGYVKCFKFPGNDGSEGSTIAKFLQEVTDPSNNPCHPANGGGGSCDFQVQVEKENKYGDVMYSGSEDPRIVRYGTPNLASPHRRSVSVRVERNDGYRIVTAHTLRQLISLGSKERGGEDGSSNTFWATVPLDGLVYTVVHDPPGGYSYAELSSGSEISMEYTLTNARVVGTSSKYGIQFDEKAGTHFSGGTALGYQFYVEMDTADMTADSRSEDQISIELPSLTTKSNTRDSWDMTLITDRTIRSSQDSGTPGRAGTVILGGGIELVYEVADVLDLTGTKNGQEGTNCLDVYQSITWEPRKPTSYLLSVHAIQAQVLPNLQFLLLASSSNEVIWNNSSDWRSYIRNKISAWKRTLDWSDPKHHQAPYASKGSVFGRHILEEQANYNAQYDAPWGSVMNSFRLKNVEEPLESLQKEWLDAIEIDMGTVYSMGSLAGIGIGAGVGKYFSKSGTGTTNPWLWALMKMIRVGVTAALAPLGPLTTSADWLDDPNGSGKSKSQRWNANYIRKSDLKPDYQDVLASGDGFYYSFGMTNENVAAMDSAGFDSDTIGELDARGVGRYVPPSDTSRIRASLMGGHGPDGMSQREKPILLTFSGGGTSLDFTFSSRETLDSKAYEVDIGIEGGIVMEGESSFKMKAFLYGILRGVKTHLPMYHSRYYRDFHRNRAFMWNKHGHMHTLYSLGDSEFGDKFVVHVNSDTRFGTPVFLTKGGRSKCPGEENTVYRESGISLELPIAMQQDTTWLNPDQRAIFAVVIKNESPYRESQLTSLRLIDGLTSSLDDIVSAAYAAASADKADAESVKRAVDKKSRSVIAKDSAEVARVVNAVKETFANNATATEVARAAYVTRSAVAPYQDKSLGDSMFTINANKLSLGSYIPFKFVPGDALERQQFIGQQYLNLAVTPGFATSSIKYLQLRAQSLCETQIWETSNFYRNPLGFTINVKEMSWLKRCPRAQFDETTISKYSTTSVSQKSQGTLNLNIVNPDQYVLWPDASISSALMNKNLAKVRLQYRSTAGGEWITAKYAGAMDDNHKFNILCDDSRTVGCKFNWDVANQYDDLLSGFKDGSYELRLKTFCVDTPTLADVSVQEYVSDKTLLLHVDTKPPLEYERTSSGDTFFSVAFNEAIDCTDQSVSITRVKSKCEGGVAMSEPVSDNKLAEPGAYELTCSLNNGMGIWTIAFPKEAVGVYEVTVNGIKDTAGNVAKTIAYRTKVHCSESSPSTGSSLGRRDRMLRRTSGAPSVGGATANKFISQVAVTSSVSVLSLVVVLALVALARTRSNTTKKELEPLRDQRELASSLLSSYGSNEPI